MSDQDELPTHTNDEELSTHIVELSTTCVQNISLQKYSIRVLQLEDQHCTNTAVFVQLNQFSDISLGNS